MQKQFLLAVAATCLFLSVQGQNIGIGTTNPRSTFHVEGGTVLFTGDTGSAILSGPGKRFMWMPGKAAFRAGMVDKFGPPGTENAWDEVNIGEYSFAAGNTTRASGFGSVSLGGPICNATGENAFAMGSYNAATGRFGFSHGVYGHAEGDYSLTIGHSASASGYGSRALGVNVSATGEHATAIGYFLEAQSYASVVLGQHNIVQGNPKEWVSTDPALVYGNGNLQQPSNAFTLYKNGNLVISGRFSQNSDARLKKDITRIDNSLDKIMALNGYNYHWQNQDIYESSLQSGLLAQEVQQQMPELVHEAEDKILSVNYNGMTPYLIEAVKELKKQIEVLEEKIKQLENRH